MSTPPPSPAARKRVTLLALCLAAYSRPTVRERLSR
jgi:hypothetical protein